MKNFIVILVILVVAALGLAAPARPNFFENDWSRLLQVEPKNEPKNEPCSYGCPGYGQASNSASQTPTRVEPVAWDPWVGDGGQVFSLESLWGR